MTTAIPIYTASKTRTGGRPGWSITFNHPCRTDARGKPGKKVRRGLGTTDDAEADRLVEQLDTLLADPSWWSLDRRSLAEHQFHRAIVAAFFDEMEAGKVRSKDLRETALPLPTQKEDYARVMLVGATGAGKTTLLRQLIGSDPKLDRFPSTSTAKTTTADIEIITGDTPFKAAITFMTEHEVCCAVEECLEAACEAVVRGQSDTRIAEALLEHREQRFRLSYPLGAWQQEEPEQATGDEYEEYEMDFGDQDEESEGDVLEEVEVVGNTEMTSNNQRLAEYVGRIKGVATAVRGQMPEERGDFDELNNANQRQDWLEGFTDLLYENQDFAQLSLDIMEVLTERFDSIETGSFERSATGWPTLWHYEDDQRGTFLQQVRWFSSNHDRQMGRLLTPLVDGVRVQGPFQPAAMELQDNGRHLVLLDGEGLGHSAKEATSVSTKVTGKFPEVDMILLVDSAQSPLQAASLELLRAVGSGGHGDKISVAFTHFDQVKGDNLNTYQQKRNHVRASITNALSSLRDSLGAPVAEILERRLEERDFYLGGLHRPTEKIPSGYIREIQRLLERMEESAEPADPIDVAPHYNISRLELALRDATDGFKSPWRGRLGLDYYEGIPKEHWGRVKALCRRIANRWDDEYNGLRPVADLVRQLQNSISLWLDHPSNWTRVPSDEDEGQAAINEIRQRVFSRIHSLSEERLIASRGRGWRTAFGFSGSGSSRDRALEMSRIYEAAAPSISSNPDERTQEFLNQITLIVGGAVKEAGGTVEGIKI